MSDKERIEKEEKTRVLLTNMKSWSWDVIPQFRIEEDDKDVVIEALERMLINMQLRGISKNE